MTATTRSLQIIRRHSMVKKSPGVLGLISRVTFIVAPLVLVVLAIVLTKRICKLALSFKGRSSCRA